MGVSRIDYNNETLIDISGDTVTPETLAEGETAHNSNGERIVGTMKAGGSTEEIMWIEATVNLATMSVQYISHTYQEILEVFEQNKIVKIKLETIKGISVGEIISFNDSEKALFGQIMVQADLGNGVKLYYFTLIINQNNITRVTPYIINTTSLGG